MRGNHKRTLFERRSFLCVGNVAGSMQLHFLAAFPRKQSCRRCQLSSTNLLQHVRPFRLRLALLNPSSGVLGAMKRLNRFIGHLPQITRHRTPERNSVRLNAEHCSSTNSAAKPHFLSKSVTLKQRLSHTAENSHDPQGRFFHRRPEAVLEGVPWRGRARRPVVVVVAVVLPVAVDDLELERVGGDAGVVAAAAGQQEEVEADLGQEGAQGVVSARRGGYRGKPGLCEESPDNQFPARGQPFSERPRAVRSRSQPGRNAQHRDGTTTLGSRVGEQGLRGYDARRLSYRPRRGKSSRSLASRHSHRFFERR